MSDDAPEADEVDSSGWKREVLEKCRFVHTTFSSSPMLEKVEPTATGFVPWFRYTGQDYDPAQWRLIPGGWNHEHCFLCLAHIVENDTYWRNTGKDEVELCEGCYSRFLDGRTA